MGANRLARLRAKYSIYHTTNANKRPIGTMIDGRFVHLEDAPDELEVASEIAAQVEIEERDERLRAAIPVTAWFAPEEDL